MTTGGDFDYKAFRKDWDNLLERQKYKEAEKLCHEGLAKSPLDQSRGRLYNHLGYLYENFLDDKTFDDILEHYVLSLQVDESNANSHYNLANFLLEQGMQHLLRALELNPNHGKANKRYANLTPIKANTTLDFNGHKYQVVEVVEDGVRATRLRKRADGGYELSEDAPVYVEVSQPEKVHPSSGKKSQRTNNMANGDGGGGGGRMNGMEIEDGGYNNNGAKRGCCVKCVGYWWFWALLWILAVGGVAVPVLGYLIFKEEKCQTNVYQQTTEAVNIDTDTQGSLNALFVVDCDADDYNGQFDTINSLLSDMENVNIDYNIMQYCTIEATDGGGDIGVYYPSQIPDFTEYDPDTDITFTSAALAVPALTPATLDASGEPYLTGALEACQDVYQSLNDSSTAPFLCMPFISKKFGDAFLAMDIAASTDFADIYLAFMLEDVNVENGAPGIISVLGAFTTGTECINELNDEGATGNSWWTTPLTSDCSGAAETTCIHCLDASQTQCGAKSLSSIFDGDGVTQATYEALDEEETCHDTYTEYYFYAIGGVVPLLFWVLVTMFVLCCCSKRNGTRNNMDASINGDNKQTAFV
mmetsp:Transcript_41908/g.37117  ORF Transcript_41908/g.37117 Transcript_41908/m.37117 type:complete len:586 (-) Transcript_41908:121-1878(-)